MPEWIVKEDPNIAIGMHSRAKITILGGTIEDEVIRCKDCMWNYGSICVRFAEVYVKKDDFCSRGERRTEEDDDDD